MANLKLQLKPGTGDIFAGILVRMRDPVRPIGRDLLGIMRKGPGSVDAQFQQKTEMTERGSRPWPKTKKFGECLPKKGTLENTGLYRGAWTGGAGSTERITKTSISTGASEAVFPFVGILQAKKATRIFGKRKDARGRFLMQLAIFAKCGIWVSRNKIEEGFVIRPRRVGVSRVMLERFRDRVLNFLIEGR